MRISDWSSDVCSSDLTADLVDVYAALEHVVSLVESRRLDIASVNLSVATSALFSGSCDASPALNGAIDAFRSIIDHLALLRVPVVAAAGNDGSSGQLAFPACLSSAVSVGATDLHDEMAPFPNPSPTPHPPAPGAPEATP